MFAALNRSLGPGTTATGADMGRIQQAALRNMISASQPQQGVQTEALNTSLGTGIATRFMDPNLQVLCVARIVATGPNGEPDTNDETYWCRVEYSDNTGSDWAQGISLGLVALKRADGTTDGPELTWFKATCLEEIDAVVQHLIPVDGSVHVPIFRLPSYDAGGGLNCRYCFSRFVSLSQWSIVAAQGPGSEVDWGVQDCRYWMTPDVASKAGGDPFFGADPNSLDANTVQVINFREAGYAPGSHLYDVHTLLLGTPVEITRVQDVLDGSTGYFCAEDPIPREAMATEDSVSNGDGSWNVECIFTTKLGAGATDIAKLNSAVYLPSDVLLAHAEHGIPKYARVLVIARIATTFADYIPSHPPYQVIQVLQPVAGAVPAVVVGLPIGSIIAWDYDEDDVAHPIPLGWVKFAAGKFLVGNDKTDVGEVPYTPIDATGGFKWHGATQNNHPDHAAHCHAVCLTCAQTDLPVTIEGGFDVVQANVAIKAFNVCISGTTDCSGPGTVYTACDTSTDITSTSAGACTAGVTGTGTTGSGGGGTSHCHSESQTLTVGCTSICCGTGASVSVVTSVSISTSNTGTAVGDAAHTHSVPGTGLCVSVPAHTHCVTLPAHNHAISYPTLNHTHSFSCTCSVTTATFDLNANVLLGAGDLAGLVDVSVTISGDTGGVKGGDANNLLKHKGPYNAGVDTSNSPPFHVVTWIKRVA